MSKRCPNYLVPARKKSTAASAAVRTCGDGKRRYSSRSSPVVAHEVTNTGSDRAQLANIASRAKDVLGVEKLEAVADRGYYSGEEILACDKAGIGGRLPKPMTSGLEARGRFGKQDFVYLSDEDAYRCPAGERLTYHYTNAEAGQEVRAHLDHGGQDGAR